MQHRITASARDAIRNILMKYWDPIGVEDEPEAQDEYDDYIPVIWKLLISRESARVIAATLQAIEIEQMGLPANQPRALSAAEKLRLIEVQL